jgi:acyl-coenzyme A thioesterase PaaI-like protein
MSFEPRNPAFVENIKSSFLKQQVMSLIGAELARIEPGLVTIRLPYRNDLSQQDGYLHAGIVTTIIDSACGYAAYTLMPPGMICVKR